MNSNIVYPELSYKLMGILFNIHNELGNRYQEKYYQRAVEVKFKEIKIPFKKEICIDLNFSGQKIGKYFLDFLVDNKIILELKAKPALTKVDYKQVRAYLQASKLELGILANFYKQSLEYKRILNFVK